jgi:hypothetical protein
MIRFFGRTLSFPTEKYQLFFSQWFQLVFLLDEFC